ncbi:MAG: permease [Pseudomonadota bacterium]
MDRRIGEAGGDDPSSPATSVRVAMASCCASQAAPEPAPCCAVSETGTAWWQRLDWLLWGSAGAILIAYLASFAIDAPIPPAEAHAHGPGAHHSHAPSPAGAMDMIAAFAHAVREMVHLMWWGILIGMVAVGLIDRVPRQFVIGTIGRDQGLRGILRAISAGVLLDLCSHGVLMVGAKMYERGASRAQVFAFLIASPWNSLSLTIIIGVMMGWGWLAVFLIGSAVVALATGLIVEALERAGRILPNPNRIDLPEGFDLWAEARAGLRATRFDGAFMADIARRSVTASRMILRWLLFGVVLAALIQTAVPTETFQTWFGATLLGLFTTLIAAAIIEVCSEGSVPIAADLMNRAAAPGNAFTFLMAGVATDYTEIMVLRQTIGRLRAALLLPLLTVPQVVLIGWALNSFS